jgi:hypothetical protein
MDEYNFYPIQKTLTNMVIVYLILKVLPSIINFINLIK